MISITSKSPYAVRALAELVLRRRQRRPCRWARSPAAAAYRHNSSSSSSRCCAARASSRSQRGVKGGYTLRPRPRRRSRVLEVVELLDGPLGQGAEGVFAEAAAAARAVLAQTTIADVLDRERRDAGGVMYHI